MKLIAIFLCSALALPPASGWKDKKTFRALSIQALRANDESEWLALRKFVSNAANSLGWRSPDSDDIIQEIMLAIFSSLTKNISDLNPYIWGIIHHVHSHRVEKSIKFRERYEPLDGDYQIENSQRPDSLAINQDKYSVQKEALISALGKISDSYKDVIVRYVNGDSPQQIMSELGLSKNSYQLALHHAQKSLAYWVSIYQKRKLFNKRLALIKESS